MPLKNPFWHQMKGFPSILKANIPYFGKFIDICKLLILYTCYLYNKSVFHLRSFINRVNTIKKSSQQKIDFFFETEPT